jgi:hypothetical protein
LQKSYPSRQINRIGIFICLKYIRSLLIINASRKKEMNIFSTVEYRPQQQESPISAEKSRQQNQSPPAEAGANGNTFCKYPTTGGAESLKEMRDQRTVAASPHSQIKSPANVKTVGSYKSKRVFKVRKINCLLPTVL